MNQKAIIVNSDASLAALNELLSSGWNVVSSCAMPSSVTPSSVTPSFPPTCLVIVQPVASYKGDED